MRTIGLTGGIGSGKSTVASMLVACGAVLVDTDAIARTLTAPGGDAIAPLAQRFGPFILGADGALDRQRMRELAFGDIATKAQLEAVLHPMIGTEAARQALAAAGHVIVFDVPLLTESSHWRARVERVLVVDCDEATQRQRVLQRPGWTEEATARVIAQQASRARRRAIADAVIFNQGVGLDALALQVHALWALWQQPHDTLWNNAPQSAPR